MERLEQMEKIYEMEREDPLTCFLLGTEYSRAKRHGDAARVLSECVKFDPEYTAAWKLLGDSLRHVGRNMEALEAYRRGVEVAEKTGDLQVKKECNVFIQKLSDP